VPPTPEKKGFFRRAPKQARSPGDSPKVRVGLVGWVLGVFGV
jgi:hypothetical protein